jgi:hypothetical protein
MSDDFLSSLGFQLKDLVPGIEGGIAHVFLFRKSKPWDIISSIVVGGLAANYLGPTVSNVTGTPEGAAAFIVGLAGMAICQRIVESAGSWTPFKGKRENE